MIAAVTAYNTNAIQLPISPSPARYQVPVAHPPANTIPIPKIKEPITVPNIGKLCAGICKILVAVKINNPIL